MSNEEVPSKAGDKQPARNPVPAKPVGGVRLEMNQGSLTHSHRHETECMLIVLNGACRVYMRDRSVTLRENEMLHIPPQHEHAAEALTHAVALRISAAARDWNACVPLLQNDLDQYL